MSLAPAGGGEAMMMTAAGEGWRGVEMGHDRGGVWYPGDKGAGVRGKAQAAMASVIVRPSTCIRYDGSPPVARSGAMAHKEAPPPARPYTTKLLPDSPRPGELGRDGGRVIQPSAGLEEMCVQYKKVRGLGPVNSIAPCRTDIPAPTALGMFGKLGRSTEVSQVPARAHLSPHKASSASRPEMQDGLVGAPPPPCPSPSPSPSPSPILSQAFSPSFIHLKKHKAALAAAQSRSSTATPTPTTPTPAPKPPTPTPPSVSAEPPDSSKPPLHNSPPPTTQASSSSSSVESCAGRQLASCPVPNGQVSLGAGASQQPSNYHKLKKAWLTRHSEEDRSVSNTSAPSSTSPSPAPSSAAPPPAGPPEKAPVSSGSMTEMIKPCTVNLIAPTSSEVEMSKEGGKVIEKERQQEEKPAGGAAGATEEKKAPPPARRATKRTYESGSESGGDESDASESKMEGRAKRQPKPTYKKKQNDLAKRRGDDRDEEEIKPNGIFRSAREKTKLKLASSNGIPRSVLKDWRKVKKLKQTGESFLQDDSCSEIGPNLQKCRECRVVRGRKGEEPAHSPVFCRFYYFRRLSYSKNGVVRMDGFSSPEQCDEEARSLWVAGGPDKLLDRSTAHYILSFIGDQFCQMVLTENTAATWVKKDAKLVWKRAVRGVREMCDTCEATLFNIHWVCQKCGFVVCLDCYKAKERRSSRDKELYSWLKCVKGQPHDHKHMMPTQIIPGTVLAELVSSMHSLRERLNIKAHCPCSSKLNLINKTTNGVSQVLQNVLNHSNKLSLVKSEGPQQNSERGAGGGAKTSPPETNGGGTGGGGGESPGSDGGNGAATPPESQSPLDFLADLAEQKAREEKKENKESVCLSKSVKEEKEGDSLEVLQQCKTSSLVSNSTEQGSTLRDLLTTTAGKLRLGSTDAGIAFAPVYSTASQTGKGGRSMPNILDDIIASVVENKIPASRQNSNKLSIKPEPLPLGTNPAPITEEAVKSESRKKMAQVAMVTEELTNQYPDIPHCWLYDRKLLWLKDHRNHNNWKLFRECWKQGQPVLVSGVHKRLNPALWKAESFNQEFADHQGDLLSCRDQLVSNTSIKEFWDGFEDITKRPKSKDGEPVVYRLKDWPSGEEFMALMPSRYDDLMRNLPLPEYSDPEGTLNLASHLPTFFIRPDLGPRLCCAYGVAASQDQDFGTANLHVEVSDIVSVLVYVGVAKGNGVLSKTGVLKRLEEEELDEAVRRRLKDSSETPGALWHIYLSRDHSKVRQFLHKLCKEQGLDISADQDPLREHSWYLSRKQRQRLLEEHGVQGWTVVQFLGDSVLIPAGALHQVQNLHSCVQVINDFVSPEHVSNSFHLTQELRATKDEVNYEDKLQVKNILYHCVKEAVASLKRSIEEEEEEKS